jgi:hypothetical protein
VNNIFGTAQRDSTELTHKLDAIDLVQPKFAHSSDDGVVRTIGMKHIRDLVITGSTGVGSVMVIPASW